MFKKVCQRFLDGLLLLPVRIRSADRCILLWLILPTTHCAVEDSIRTTNDQRTGREMDLSDE